MLDLKRHFSQFLGANAGHLHMAAHSHHYWPDVTQKAQNAYWLDSARPDKWERIIGEVIPALQGHIAGTLKLPDPATIVFAPNTHELVMRILSCFPTDRPVHVLTTASEFHSFSRQIARLEEEGLGVVTRLAVEPFADFPARFRAAIEATRFDLVFFSHVFFDSGFAVSDFPALIGSVRDPETFVVLDGYHGFMATPTDLSVVASRAFYLAGGYKYAMSGEGACFMHCPPGFGPRPRDTGWFAALGALDKRQGGGQVPYPADGGRFWGATFDASGLYRMRAVFEWLASLPLSVAQIHAHSHALQQAFVDGLGGRTALDPAMLAVPLANDSRGNFLTFRTEKAAEWQKRLMAAGVETDCRGDRLRFGFGLYHSMDDMGPLLKAIMKALS